MTRPRHAEIAGAGFAGLAAAIALRQRGWSVRVHEANAELRELGAGIFVWENGLLVLGALGARDEVLAAACKPPCSEVRVDGVQRSRQPTNSEGNYPMLTMTRQVLYAALLTAARKAGAQFVTNSRVAGATAQGELLLADGQRLAADLVIGADGVRSSVRESLGMKTVRQRYDDGIIRVLTSRKGFQGGEWDHVIDFWTRQPRTRRILYVPCDPDTAYLALMTSAQDTQGSAIPIDTALWSQAIPELAPLLAEAGARGRYDSYESTRVQSWSQGRAALVGDAASAMPPTLGQGAGIAMSNALALAVALDENPDIEAALAQWEARERPFTEATQAKAEELAAMGDRRIDVPKSALGQHGARVVPTGANADAPAALNLPPAALVPTAWYQAAWRLVLEKHQGKTDPLGRPYEEHFIRVTRRLLGMFPQATPAQIQAALLHDALEPGGYSVETLRERGISAEAIRMIQRITLPTDGRSYLQYSQDLAASGDVEAIQVKLADNADAFELFAGIGTPEALARIENQYKPSRAAMQAGLPRTA